MSESIKLGPSAEQQAVIDSKAETLVVNAFAGTGKTTTLIEYALARPRQRITYLAFNQAIKAEAARRFPSNVKCMTTHGLAFPSFGSRYQGKVGQIKPSTLARQMNLTPIQAGAALETINNYLYSTDDKLDEEHIAGMVQSSDQGAILDLARNVWKKMCDTGDTSVFIPHDGYLKLYQVSKPRINTDIILFDEAQDANPTTLDIVRQQRCGKVFVGDKNQAIYGFRQSVDALNNIKADERLDLTTSFRFGSGTAALATLLLRDWKGEQKIIRGMGEYQTGFVVNQNAPHAVIGRTNSGIFDAAVQSLLNKRPYGFVGGVEGYRMDMIKDAYYLKKNLRSSMKDAMLLGFQNFAEMENYAAAMDDKELKMLAKIIDTYGDDIPRLRDAIKANARMVLDGTEVALSTAHKSKGLEWNSVLMLDDYFELKEKVGQDGQIEPPSEEELNIIYVAATRAKKNLHMNDATVEWLDTIGMRQAVATGNLSLVASHRPDVRCRMNKALAMAKKALKAELDVAAATTTISPASLLQKIQLAGILSAEELKFLAAQLSAA